jgi:hypothetical protein
MLILPSKKAHAFELPPYDIHLVLSLFFLDNGSLKLSYFIIKTNVTIRINSNLIIKYDKCWPQQE